MKNYTVIYRVGGTARFEWRKCLPVSSYEEASTQRSDIERMGYKALVHDSAQLLSIGLPETWE